jgi:hypothetical protein
MRDGFGTENSRNTEACPIIWGNFGLPAGNMAARRRPEWVQNVESDIFVLDILESALAVRALRPKVTS